MEAMIYVLIFGLGIIVGIMIKIKYTVKFKEYDGTIYVNKDRATEKVVYTLELGDYPEKLEFKKLVIFKVDNTDE